MSDDHQFRQEQSVYTAPAENGGFQFSSSLQSGAEIPRPKETKSHSSIGLVIVAALILLAAGIAFCALILHMSLSVRHDENGYSIELVRRRSSEPIVRLEKENPGGNGVIANPPVDSADRYEWTGESLRMSGAGSGQEMSFSQIYESCAPSVGILCAADSSGRTRSGAVIVMTEDGALVASTHIISGADSLTVTLGGREYDAYIIGLDYATDLAVLKIEAEGLTTATFSGERLLPGDTVAVIGNPAGGVVNITAGILSAANPSFDYRGYHLEAYQFGMQLGDIASGSALVNAAGQIIGIVNGDMANQFSDSAGISYAISMHSAKDVIEELLKSGFVAGRPSSGLTVSELPAAYAAYYEYPTCLYISAVQESSPAADAGLRRGDLILAANGEEVNGVSELYSIINSLKAGDWLTLVISRDGVAAEVSFQLMEAASPANN